MTQWIWIKSYSNGHVLDFVIMEMCEFEKKNVFYTSDGLVTHDKK